VFGGLHEIHTHVPHPERNSVALLFLAASSAVFSTLFARSWWVARFPALALAPVIALVLAVRWLDGLHPLAGYGLLAWPTAFLLHFLILRGDDRVRDEQHERAVPTLQYLPWLHALGVWLLALACAWELAWQIDRIVTAGRAWSLVGWAFVPALLLAIAGSPSFRSSRLVERHREAYLWLGAAPIASYAMLWSLYAAWRSDGNAAPLPYVPLLNPLDIAQLFVFAALVSWARSHAAGRDDAHVLRAPWTRLLLGAVVFVWANAVLLRTLHHWADVPYRLEPIVRSDLAQTALSIFWTVIALLTMVFATRRAHRALWLIGAGLMAAVVLKLFIIDLAKVGGVERIVSFIAVGVLMLVIGYFSPVPPRRELEQS
jgi:uncharacterized membrane protein